MSRLRGLSPGGRLEVLYADVDGDAAPGNCQEVWHEVPVKLHASVSSEA